MLWRARLLGVAISTVLCCVQVAWAQTGTAVITGTVQDNAGQKPIEGVVVMATSPALQGEQIAVTDKAGVYRIPNLSPGVYKITFDRDGYHPNERSGFALRAGITIQINTRLASTTGSVESVQVVQKAPTVDVGSSSTGSSLNSEFLKRVPVSAPGSKGSAARSFESVASSAPNANGDSYGTSISGTTSPENRYVIDGLAVNNPGYGVVGTQLSSEFVKEVNVITAGYLPEFGRATGGVLSVITKQGSNQFHGSLFSFVSPGSLEGKRAGSQTPGQTVVYAPKLAYIGDVGGDLGGPLIKDKLWFYVGFDYARTQYDIGRSIHATDMNGNIDPNAVPGTSQTYAAILQTLQGMAKLTWQVNPDNRVTVAAYGTPSTSGAPGQFAIIPSSGAPEVGTQTSGAGLYNTMATRRFSNPYDATLKWTSEFLDKRLSFETLLGIHHQADGARAADGSGPGARTGLGSLPGVKIRRGSAGDTAPHPITDFENVPGCMRPGVSCPVTTYYTGGPDKGVTARLSDEIYNRYQGGVTATYFFEGLGHHLIKAGFDAEITTFSNLKSFWLIQESADGSYFEDEFHLGILTGPDQAKFLNPIKQDSRSVTLGGFIQDSWSVYDKFIVNVGVRYDAQYLYSGGKMAIALPNQWSPRLGVIYDPTREGRSRVFLSYARYFENAPLALADVALAGEPHARVKRDAAKCPNPGDPTNQAACNAADTRLNYDDEGDSYINPNRQFRAVGQGGAPVDPEIKAPSSDELVGGGELEVFPDARIGLSYTKRWVNRWIEDLSRDNMNTFFVANPGFGSASDFPKAKRDYDAFTLYATKLFGNNWLAQASYTLAWLRGNMTGFFRPESGDLLPNFSSDWDTKALMYTREGPLAGDNRHSLKAFGSKDWVVSQRQRIGTGVSLRAQSGGPTNYLADDVFHAPRESYILPRGSGQRLPWVYGADLQLAYRVAFSQAMTVSATVDIFNLLNFQGTLATDETFTDATVVQIKGGKPSDIVDGAGNVRPTLKDAAGNAVTKNPNFGKPIVYQEPRVFRFGLRAEF